MFYSKILVLMLLFIGKALSIYAEILGAKNNNIASHSFLQTFQKMFLLITLAGGFLVAGYMLGFKVFKNIWIVSAVSIISILIAEPIIAWAIFKQVPTNGSVIGFILGMVGLFLSIFF